MPGSESLRRTKRTGATVALAVAVALLAVVGAWAVAGALTFVEQDKNGVGGVLGVDGAIDVAVSPDGASVYAVGLGSNAVATFSRSVSTGALTFVEQDVDGAGGVDGLGGARAVDVSPDGKHVYVTGNGDGAVATFTRNATTGALTFVEQDKDGVSGVDGLAFAWGVAISGDGKHVYVASNGDDAITTFARNATTGALTFVETDKDGAAGVDGLEIATGVALSPNGANLYVGSCGDSAVAAFSRDSATGALTFVEQETDGVGGVDGLACARGVAVDPSGTAVYAVGESGDAVTTFSRNATTGALTFVETDKDGVAGVDGLDGARDVAVSPDCASVHVASAVDDAVASFSRNVTTGALTFVEQDKDGVGGVDGINQAVGVTVAPGGASVYVTGESDDAVATFARELPATTACAGATVTPTATSVVPTPTYVVPTPTPTVPAAASLRPVIAKVAKRLDRKRRLKVRLRCATVGAGAVPATCAGSLRLKVKRKAAGAKRFAFASGGRASVKLKVKLSRKARRKPSVRATLTATVGAQKATKRVRVKRSR